MTRRSLIVGALATLGGGLGLRFLARATESEPGREESALQPARTVEPLELTEAQWRELLSEAEFAVLREEATERARTSPLNEEKRAGTYVCAGCFLPLFDAAHKYESGTGWPSFYDVKAGSVGRSTDYKLVFPRTEYHCARCGGHQGHVFEDGPQPTGLRYCNNGIALRFVPDGESLPALREG